MFLYSKIKTKYELDKYILKKDFENRNIKCKMQVSDLFLEIEMNKYKRIQIECDVIVMRMKRKTSLSKCKINKSFRKQLEKDSSNICPGF